MWTRSRYDPDRLAREWKDARWAAIAPFVVDTVREKSEFAWLLEVPPRDREAVLHAVFEAGRVLGQQVRSRIGTEPTLGQIVHLISHAGTNCFDGHWQRGPGGETRALCRSHCPFVKGEFDCDYWREAARGLVSGLSDSVAFARYESIGHDGEGCVDVLYRTESVDRSYGPLPPEVLEAVNHLLDDLNRWEVSLVLVGFSEGTLYYRLVGRHFPVCRSCHSLVESELALALKSVEIEVHLKEISGESVATAAGRKRCGG